jgi:hypothetical protein
MRSLSLSLSLSSHTRSAVLLVDLVLGHTGDELGRDETARSLRGQQQEEGEQVTDVDAPQMKFGDQVRKFRVERRGFEWALVQLGREGRYDLLLLITLERG